MIAEFGFSEIEKRKKVARFLTQPQRILTWIFSHRSRSKLWENQRADNFLPVFRYGHSRGRAQKKKHRGYSVLQFFRTCCIAASAPSCSVPSPYRNNDSTSTFSCRKVPDWVRTALYRHFSTPVRGSSTCRERTDCVSISLLPHLQGYHGPW